MRKTIDSFVISGAVARGVAVAALLAVSVQAWAAVGVAPEPDSFVLLGIGVVALAIARWKKRK